MPGVLCSFLGVILSLWTLGPGNQTLLPSGLRSAGPWSCGRFLHSHSIAGTSSVAPGGPHSLAASATATVWTQTSPGEEHSPAWAPQDTGTETKAPHSPPPPSLQAQHGQGPRDSGGGAAGCPPPGSCWGEECMGLGEGVVVPSAAGGHGFCTKQACVSPEWVALSRVLTGRTWALWHHARLPGPGPVCLGRREVWPLFLGRGQRPGLCLTQAAILAGK